MNPQQEITLLESLIDELLAGLMEIMQSGEILSDEFQGTIARELEITLQRIDQLRAQESPAEELPAGGAEPARPELEPGPYPSSNVNSFKYDPTTEKLYVKFHGSESAGSGPTYLYQGVPRNIYDVFSKGRVAPKTSGQNQYHRWIRGVTPSLGASLYALIRNGGFPYQRIAG